MGQQKSRWLAATVGMFLVGASGPVIVGLLWSAVGDFSANIDAPAIVFAATAFEIPPLRNPTVVPAKEAALADDEIVFGVVLKGGARAYQRAALANLYSHVVHDEIGTQRIVVTHCVRNGCTRVFQAEPGSSPDVRLGGWRSDQTMELIVGHQRFSHQSLEIPLAELPFAEMNWAAWKQMFPDSTIYHLPQSGAEALPAIKG